MFAAEGPEGGPAGVSMTFQVGFFFKYREMKTLRSAMHVHVSEEIRRFSLGITSLMMDVKKLPSGVIMHRWFIWRAGRRRHHNSDQKRCVFKFDTQKLIIFM